LGFRLGNVPTFYTQLNLVLVHRTVGQRPRPSQLSLFQKTKTHTNKGQTPAYEVLGVLITLSAGLSKSARLHQHANAVTRCRVLTTHMMWILTKKTSQDKKAQSTRTMCCPTSLLALHLNSSYKKFVSDTLHLNSSYKKFVSDTFKRSCAADVFLEMRSFVLLTLVAYASAFVCPTPIIFKVFCHTLSFAPEYSKTPRSYHFLCLQASALRTISLKTSVLALRYMGPLDIYYVYVFVCTCACVCVCV